jgi:cardiolipin synthase
MNLPNIISLGRLVAVPAIVWLILSDEPILAFALFVGAGVSDAVDGFIAKRFNAQTDIGRFLDPIADKVLLVAVYIALGTLGVLPLWLVILVASRDFLIVGGALLSFTLDLKIRIQPLFISKINTVLQIGLAALVLAELALDGKVDHFAEILIYFVGASTVASGASYLVQWTRSQSDVETNP